MTSSACAVAPYLPIETGEQERERERGRARERERERERERRALGSR